MTDPISREEAIEAVSKACEELRGVFGRCEDALKALPSVEPERKRGKWLEIHCCDYYVKELQICKCSECGRYDTRPYLVYFSRPNFCSWCGAEMR